MRNWSPAVDWYSTVAIGCAAVGKQAPIVAGDVVGVLAHWQYPAHWSNEIRVDIAFVQYLLPKAWPALYRVYRYGGGNGASSWPFAGMTTLAALRLNRTTDSTVSSVNAV